MSLKVLPVDQVWVDRMIALAGVPWERAPVEAMFVRWGLARPREGVEWEGGPAAPQFGVDAETVGVNTGDKDEYDQEMPPLWARRPEARRADFHAERDRLAALIAARLGPPQIVVTGAYDSYRAVWQRGDRALLLGTTDDTCSAYGCSVMILRSPACQPDRRPVAERLPRRT